MKDLELTILKATVRTKDKRWVNVVSYNGRTVEWFYSNSFGIPERVGIITSQIKIEGKSRADGRLYFRNEHNAHDSNMIYLDELAILDYGLFDLDEKDN